MRATVKLLGMAMSLLFLLLGNPANLAAVSFGPATNYPVGMSPWQVVVGDFNGDGKPDLAVANSGSNFVSILLGNGDGTFQPALMADAGGPQLSIALGDFNGDGKLDLVVITRFGGASGPGVSILLGKGDGTFLPPVQIQSNANVSHVVVGDFNLDGKLDLAVAGGTVNGMTTMPFLNVFLGKGDGTFQAPTSIALAGLSGTPYSLAVADFNGDGKPDLALALGFPGALEALLGKGDGTFQTAIVTNPLVAVSYNSLVTGEFNGDNKQDLLAQVTHSGTGTGCNHGLCARAGVLLSNGDGTFLVKPVSPSIVSRLAVGDVNGDGKLDVAGFSAGNQWTIDLGKGDGTFPVVTSPITVGSPIFAALADLNGDHLPDLILTDSSSTGSNVTILLNTSQTSGADLSTSFTGVTDPAVQGQNATYTARMENTGPQDATGVTMTISLPANSTFVSASPTQGACSPAQRTVTCALGTAVSPSTAQTTITLATTTLGANTISASVAANEQDLSPADNVASATFTVIPTFTLTVLKAGAGGGIVTDNFGKLNCGNTCSAIYASDGTVILLAVADSTSIFAGWSGACNGTGPNSCSVPMTSDKTVTATFVPAVPLSVSLEGNGSVISTPPGINCELSNCIANFATGSTVTLTASTLAGSTFTSWSGACSGTDPNTCAVTMNTAQSVTANFSPPPDFTFTPASTTFTTQTGAQVTDVLTLIEQNNFSGQVTLNCTVNGPAPLATCNVSPSPVTLGYTPGTSTLTITAPATLAALTPLLSEPTNIAYALVLPFPALLLGGVGLASRKFKKRRGLSLLLGGGVIVLLAILAGCGSGNTTLPPTPQNYTVTVNATSGSLQHSTKVTLTVQ
jgi:uncharacterized repeat protein (TIGR01451 family)